MKFPTERDASVLSGCIEEKNQVVKESDQKAVLEVGSQAWPLPIPIVKAGEKWRFDTRAGKQEILNRRIGKNELSVIQVCRAYVDAQREYAGKDRDGDGLLEYAQKFVSEPGQKDGLYWEVKPGEEPSPLGPFAANAREEGYQRKKVRQATLSLPWLLLQDPEGSGEERTRRGIHAM